MAKLRTLFTSDAIDQFLKSALVAPIIVIIKITKMFSTVKTLLRKLDSRTPTINSTKNIFE